MTKAIDLTGKKFGNWNVISKALPISGRGMWNCVCDCGTSRIVSSANLMYGKTKSCGCLKKMEDLSGMTFNDLTVLSYIGRVKGNPKWKCQCSCGKFLNVFGTALKSGKAKDCGGIIHDDIVGKRFGRLVVQATYKSTGNARQYLCKCDCGKSIYSTLTNLKSGNTKSCGCLNKELASMRIKTHGKSKTRIYNIWKKIISRCEKENDTCYVKYGAQGIRVCSEWHNFNNFYNWALSQGYTDKLTIDRIDGRGDYCPENCRWITYKGQANNLKSNIVVAHDGKNKTLSEWADEFKIPYKVLHQRYRKYHWDFERAITQPVRKSGGRG